MTLADWQARNSARAARDRNRRDLEATFNAEIVRRHRGGQSRAEIIAELRITATLFDRAMRLGKGASA